MLKEGFTVTFEGMWRKEPCLKLSAYLRECGTDECFRVLEESFEAPGEQDCIDWDTFFLEKNNQILGKKIEEFSRQRITDRKRMLAFAAARHPRLGAFSPARVLIKDTLKLIFKAMKDIEFVVVMMPGVEEADEESKIRAAPFSGVFRFSLENFRFSKLPDPPEPLNFARLNVVGLGGGRFVVAGGRKGKYRRNVVVNQHIWLFDGRSWEKIPACLDRLLGVAAVVPHREGKVQNVTRVGTLFGKRKKSFFLFLFSSRSLIQVSSFWVEETRRSLLILMKTMACQTCSSIWKSDARSRFRSDQTSNIFSTSGRHSDSRLGSLCLRQESAST